jgi:uncharacterized repeat protein (TIGR03803 family)
MTPGGVLTTLHSFDSTDGYAPAGMVEAANGTLYGTTGGGGANTTGTIFKITLAGMLTTLYSFGSAGGNSQGAPMILATDGNIYLTTPGTVPALDEGKIYRITPGGKLTVLHSFRGADGCLPYAGLVQGTDGNFYGTTWGCGGADAGTVFSLSVGLGPFVETLPTSGQVGAAINILEERI